MKPAIVVILLIIAGAIACTLFVKSNTNAPNARVGQIAAAPEAPTRNAQMLKQPFAKLLQGQSQKQVLQLLGQPKTKSISQYPQDPFWGPQEGLGKVLPKHQKYIEFTYSDGKNDFYIWFSGEDAEDPSTWILVSKATYPVSVEF